MHHGIYVDVFIFDTLPLENTEEYVNHCLTLNRQAIRKYVPTVNKEPSQKFDDNINKEFTKYVNESYDNRKLACLIFNDPYYFYENDIFPTQTIKFEDYEFPVPNNYDKHLKTYYGEYMVIPSVENRETHSVKLVDFNRSYKK